MVLDEVSLQKLSVNNGFRLRGASMTRMEVFSDAAFAFALTMLVVSVGAVPQNHDELINALKSIPAFAMSFTQLAAFWLAHRTWSNRYGLEDKSSTFLTLLMIFFILVFVYPLRLIFSAFCAFISGGWLPSDFIINSIQELSSLFIVYGIGYAVLATLVCLLYMRSYRIRRALRLNEREILQTRRGIFVWGIQACFGFASAAMAWLAPMSMKMYAGFVYFGLAVAMPWISIHFGKKDLLFEQAED